MYRYSGRLGWNTLNSERHRIVIASFGSAYHYQLRGIRYVGNHAFFKKFSTVVTLMMADTWIGRVWWLLIVC